jgi:hypothetical protein
MKSIIIKIKFPTLIGLFLVSALTSCKKDGNPHNLPGVSPDDYAGLIDGYNSSDEIFPANLIAHWTFDDTKDEKLSSISPTSSQNDQYVDGGVRGRALQLNSGFVYYGTQFPQFTTDALKSWTISHWVKILNNGSKRTMTFQLARPGVFNGNINVALNTQSRPATNDTQLTIQPTFAAINATSGASNMQDNLNAAHGGSGWPFLSPRIGADKWTHIVITYDRDANNIQIWADGIKIGVPAYQNRGVNYFNSFEPNEVIIGSNYNGIPGMSVSGDVSFAPMTGTIDEIRIFNIALPDAHIKALHNLGRANK